MRINLTALFILLSLLLTSCQSQEESVITRIEKLSVRIDKEGKNFTTEDWEDALDDLAEIHEDIQDCDFTTEQLKELGKVEGRLSAIIAKEASKAVGHSLSDIIKNFGSFASGFKEGLEENVSEEDFVEPANEISDALKAVEQELKK